MPAEVVRVDSGEHTGLFVLVDLAARNEASRVAQRKAVAVAVVLGSLVVDYRDEVVVSVAGGSAAAIYELLSEVQRIALYVALPRPGAVEGDHVVILAVKLNAGREQSAQLDGVGAAVLHLYGAGDNVQLLEHAVLERDLKPVVRVLAVYLKAGNFVVGVGVGRGETLQLLLALIDGVAVIVALAGAHAVLVHELHARLAEISDAACRELDGSTVEGVRSHSVVCRGYERLVVRDTQHMRDVRLGNGSAIIKVQQVVGIRYVEGVGGIRSVKLEHPLLFVVDYRHFITSLVLIFRFRIAIV